MRKFIRYIVIFLIMVVAVGAALFLRVLPSMAVKIDNTNQHINCLDISDDIYFRQTLNNCAPYSVMGVINILDGRKLDPELLAKETKWRMTKNLTYPQGLVDLLRRYNIKTKEYNLRLYSGENKIRWLKNQVDQGYPVILLVKVKNIQHYFTVIGYDDRGFMLYDSLQEKENDRSRKTVTDRGDYPGNRYYTNDELIGLWDRGGYKLFFRNWAVVCKK